MSRAISVSTGIPYGVERVCEVLEKARSTFSECQERAEKLAHPRDQAGQARPQATGAG
jgi:hypothetical protein